MVMSSSYLWETHQQSARMQYGFARYMLLRPILMDARRGSLDPNWREHLTLDASATHPKLGLPIATNSLCLRSRRWILRHGRRSRTPVRLQVFAGARL